MTKDFVSPHVSASVDGPEVIELGLVAVLGSLAVEGAALLLSENRTSLASGAGVVFADSLVSGHDLSETTKILRSSSSLGKSCLSLSVTLGFAFLAVSLGKSSVNGKRVYPSA